MKLRYYSLSTYMRQRFGQRVQKIPLDGGFSCPNRDGTLSSDGCIFCNPQGSGTGLLSQGLSLAEQWDFWQQRIKKRYSAKIFWAYLQSYSNTYGPIKRLQRILEEIKPLPDLKGLSIGTRPDCLDKDKIDLISSFPSQEIWVELGLQSAHDSTLSLINRGHDLATFIHAVEMLSQKPNIRLCIHLIMGLPGENTSHVLKTIETLNRLPVHGVKIHNLFVCKNTVLEEWVNQGKYKPIGFEQFVKDVVTVLEHLRPDIVIQRLNGDPDKNQLVAPLWSLDKQNILSSITSQLLEKKSWQGLQYAKNRKTAPWFDPQNPLPESLT